MRRFGIWKKEKNAICPYCDFELEKKPTRKKKCPNCGDYIWVRTPYLDKKSKEKLLFTEEQVKIFDKEKRRYYDRKNWINRLYSYDVTEKEFDRETENLKKRFGFNPPYADVAWGLLGRRKLRFFEALEFGRVSSVCHDMARICYEENKPFQHFLEEASKYELMGKEGIGENAIIHIASSESEVACPKCKEVLGKRLTYKEAKEKKLLPVLECENIEEGKGAGQGFCRCWYGLDLKDNK